MRLRVLTFNVWNEEGDSRRIEFINRELRRLAINSQNFSKMQIFTALIRRKAWQSLRQVQSAMVARRFQRRP